MASSPKPPNPYQQASAQQGAETGAAIGSSIINNPNEISPYGTVNYQIAGWEQVPDAQGKMQYVPRYTRTTSLSPDEQRIAGWDTATRHNLGRTATQQSAKIGDYLNQGINSGGWQAWNSGRAPGENVDRAALEKAMLSRWEENTGKQSAAEDAQLAARGLAPGSQGYGSVADTRARARTDAVNQAYLQSGQEARAWAELDNQLRQAQASEGFALRNQPINEIMALMGGSQVNMPQFAAFSRQGINAAPVGSYIGDAYANQVNAASARNQGLFGLGGAVAGGVGQAGGIMPFLGLSDRRLKTDIVLLESSFAGLPLYEFSYRDSPELRHVGVMSDEVKELYPEAVWVREDGFEMVDYGMLARRH